MRLVDVFSQCAHYLVSAPVNFSYILTFNTEKQLAPRDKREPSRVRMQAVSFPVDPAPRAIIADRRRQALHSGAAQLSR